ncbi:MAG: CDP-alcohol phosphatidyltransferase family protein [Candidatus Andersenbacteria bacterium]
MKQLFQFEQRGYQTVAAWRDRAFLPIAKVLAAIGITPDMLGYLRVLTMGLFVVMIERNLSLAFFLFVVSLSTDWIDGVLARHQGSASLRGRFIDLLCDNSSFALFIIGLLVAQLLTPITATAYVFITLLANVLRIMRNGLYFKLSHYLSATVVGVASLTTGLTRLLFALYVLTTIDYLELSSQLFSVVLVIEVVWSSVIIARLLNQRGATAQ